MPIISIRDIQGVELLSPYANKVVTTTGVVTAVVRRGFFLQTPEKAWDGQRSDAIFVFSPGFAISQWSEVEVTGECIDFIQHATAKPVTQLKLKSAQIGNQSGRRVKTIELTSEFLPSEPQQLAEKLNALEGMLIKIAAGQTFIAPSNHYGDYVLTLDAENIDLNGIRTVDHGIITTAIDPSRWFPSFRLANNDHAPRLNVGARLTSKIIGPLNFRADSYQLLLSQPFKHESHDIGLNRSSLKPSDRSLTIMTLNCFNLDPHIENQSHVLNPSQDIDDDWGEGRFHSLAHAVVDQANTPDIVALQEIQDNDGAEITEVVDASITFQLLIQVIHELSGVQYKWVDIPPIVGADGGQPGGNIRNAYLYNPKRVALTEGSVRLLGERSSCYQDSRKPLVVEFIEKASGKKLTVINVHLASKRHQASIFSPKEPGIDKKLHVRIEQAQTIHDELRKLKEVGAEYYVTGDFNDTENSKTMRALIGQNNINLVETLPMADRYDYNHRGKLQVLMHGIVSKQMADKADYEIIHGNELIGVQPGERSDKPSDHAYVIAKLALE